MSSATEKSTFRFGTPADAQALHELSRRTVIDTFAHLNDPTDFADFLEKNYAFEHVMADLADPAVRVLLCEVDSTLAAYARLSSREIPECIGDGNSIQIERFYVDKPYIGRGVAPAMMELCLQLAVEESRSTIFLGVWEHNARAVRFYEKWGFARCGEHPFMVGTDQQIDWWMKRPVRI